MCRIGNATTTGAVMETTGLTNHGTHDTITIGIAPSAIIGGPTGVTDGTRGRAIGRTEDHTKGEDIRGSNRTRTDPTTGPTTDPTTDPTTETDQDGTLRREPRAARAGTVTTTVIIPGLTRTGTGATGKMVHRDTKRQPSSNSMHGLRRIGTDAARSMSSYRHVQAPPPYARARKSARLGEAGHLLRLICNRGMYKLNAPRGGVEQVHAEHTHC